MGFGHSGTLSRARQLAYDLVHKPPDTVCGPEGETCVDTGDDGPATCPALLAETGGEAAPSPPTEGQMQTEAVGLEDLANVLPRADLVISSTGSPEPVLKFDAVADGLRRRNRPLFIVDIAVPRDVDAQLAEVENVFLYNIDDLGRLVERNLERRRQEIPRAEAIIEDELREFVAWQVDRSMGVFLRCKDVPDFAFADQDAYYQAIRTAADAQDLRHGDEDPDLPVDGSLELLLEHVEDHRVEGLPQPVGGDPNLVHELHSVVHVSHLTHG